MKIKNLSFSYSNEPFFENINSDIPENKFISLIGPNASGKTTLLKLLCGLLKPQEGEIIFNNQNIFNLNIKERAKFFSIISQNKKTSFPFTCFEMVSFGLYPHLNHFESLNNSHIEKIYEIMEETNTYHLKDKKITEISGGEAQRIFIARALLQNPKILFADEAMSEFDLSTKIKMCKMLKSKGITIVNVNHDLQNAYQFSDYIIALKNGKVHCFGSPKEVMTKDFFRDVFNLDVEIFEDLGIIIKNNI